MINFKKIKNDLDETKIEKIEDVRELFISTCLIENEKPFEIVVKQNEKIKVNQVLMKNEDGQNLLSSVSGTVKRISLKKDGEKSVTYFLEIENDFQNQSLETKCEKINTKEDLIFAIKKYGIINKDFLIYKYLNNIDKVLQINAFDIPFVFNNYIILRNYYKKIENVLKKLRKILNIEKIEFFSSKNNLEDIKKLRIDKDKIYKKTPKNWALNLIDLYKISLILKGEILNQEIFSVTGKALNKNLVVSTHLGIKIFDIIQHFGGLKQNIEEIEDYKYMAMLAYNDERILKDKIKSCKDLKDKEKLIKMYNEKRKEAKTNLYDKRKEYHQKYLNCLSACFLSLKSHKFATKDLNLPLKMEFYGIHLLNNQQFH